MTSTIRLVKTLKEARYSFDSARNAWFCGRKPVPEEDVLIYLIRYAKSQNIRNAGEWAESALESAKSDPEITTSAFVKTRMIRNRNRRIAGKYLFQNWARAVGIEIPTENGELEMYMRRHSLIVRRFYDEIAAGYECCKKRARIAGKVLRSVFIGWELRDEGAIEWIMERYAVTRDDASGIVNDANDWADEHGNPRYILDLLLSAITVSMKTMDIVESLPRFEC